jgi:predicted membrane channel-forming protein YqfA (hemolysin III family)
MMGYKIMVGQRVTVRTVLDILTTVHTDTTNIWSHIIGALGFFYWSLLSPFPVAVGCGFASLTCLASASYHTFRNYSRRHYDIFLVLDVSAIQLQMVCYVATDAYGFFAATDMRLVHFYATVACLLAAIIIAIVPFLLRRKLYWIRTCLFVCETFLWVVPLAGHKSAIDAAGKRIAPYIRSKIAAMFWGGLGLVVRSSHVPERFCPRTVFQYVFHSHFIFHVLMGIGSVSATWAIQALVD